MKTMIIVCSCMMLCSAVMANLSGSDDFNDNTMDPAKWSVQFGDSLNETNGRLELAGGFGSWKWEINSGSYVQDWTVSLDVVNSVDESAMSNQEIGFGFLAFSPGPFDNNFFIGLTAGDDAGGSNPYRRILTEAEDSHVQVLDHAVDTTATSLQLQISFDATAKVLTSYYDSGSGLTALTNHNIASWGLADSDVFTIAIYGDTGDVTSASGEVYGDNFAAIPEPGTLSFMVVGAAGTLLTRYKKARMYQHWK